MGNSLTTKWVIPVGGTGASFAIKGWYPSSFSWNLESIQSNDIQKLRIIFGLRMFENSGHHPEVLFDQLPLPLFPNDNYVIDKFSPFWNIFEPTVVRTYFDNPSGRCEKWGKSIILIPTKRSLFNSPSDVPNDCHMAVINGYFCFSKEIIEQNKFYFRDIVHVPFGKTKVLPIPRTEDFTSSFIKRLKSDETVIRK